MSGWALGWAAQGGGGVTVPGQCCTARHGLVGNIGRWDGRR